MIIAKLDLDPKMLVIMSNLYLSKEYPYNFVTLQEAADIMQVSKATAMTAMKELATAGMVTKSRGYITFYYPVNDREMRTHVLERLGFK